MWPAPCTARASTAGRTCLNNNSEEGQHRQRSLSYQKLTDEDGGHLGQRDQTEVDEHVPRQVLGVQCPGHVEEVVDRPENCHGDEQSDGVHEVTPF